MDLEAQPQEAPKSLEGEVLVRKRGRPRKYGQPDDHPARMNQIRKIDAPKLSRERKALIKSYADKGRGWGQVLQNRAEFVRRMHRYMQADNWRQFNSGIKALMDRFGQGDQWAMEFVKNVMDGKGDFRQAVEGPGQVTININADDAKLL